MLVSIIENKGYVLIPHTYISGYVGDTSIAEANQRYLKTNYMERMKKMKYEEFLEWLLNRNDSESEGENIENELVLVEVGGGESFILCREDSEIYEELLKKFKESPVLQEELYESLLTEKLEKLYEALKSKYEALGSISFEEFCELIKESVYFNGNEAVVVDSKKVEEIIELAEEQEKIQNEDNEKCLNFNPYS